MNLTETLNKFEIGNINITKNWRTFFFLIFLTESYVFKNVEIGEKNSGEKVSGNFFLETMSLFFLL